MRGGALKCGGNAYSLGLCKRAWFGTGPSKEHSREESNGGREAGINRDAFGNEPSAGNILRFLACLGGRRDSYSDGRGLRLVGEGGLLVFELMWF